MPPAPQSDPRLVLTVRSHWCPRIGVDGEWFVRAECAGESFDSFDASREAARQRSIGTVLGRVSRAIEHGDRPVPAGIDIVDAPESEGR